MKLMIKCEETATLLSAEMDVPISTTKRMLLRMHLIICKQCYAIARQMKSLRKIFLGLEKASLQDEILMPVESKKRILQALYEQ